MKVVKGILVAALVMSITGVASASSISGKIWFTDVTDNGHEDSAMLYGGSASVSMGGNMWLSAAYLMGTYDDFDIDTKDGEIVLGYTASIVDIGIGGRISSWEPAGADDFLIFGPMAYIGLGNTIGDLPLGWYVGGSYMFKDFGDAYDADSDRTFEHYNVEGGLFLALGQLAATAGYRIKDYTDSDIIGELTFEGFVASLGFGF